MALRSRRGRPLGRIELMPMPQCQKTESPQSGETGGAGVCCGSFRRLNLGSPSLYFVGYVLLHACGFRGDGVVAGAEAYDQGSDGEAGIADPIPARGKHGFDHGASGCKSAAKSGFPRFLFHVKRGC